MKYILFTVIILSTIALNSFGQAPQGFNYQAVARDNKGVVLASKSVSLRISILDKSPSGGVLYSETFSPTTNQFGLFSISIGNGSAVSGTFSTIAWGTNDKYLRVEMDASGGSSYIIMGTTQLLAVPYAMYANKAGNSLKGGTGIQISNDTIINTATDKILKLTGTGTIQVSGTYPNLNIHGDSAKLYGAGTGITLSGTTFSAQNSTAMWNGSELQGNSIAAVTPINNQVLKWNGKINKWAPQTDTTNTYLSGTGLQLSGNTFSATNTSAMWNASQLQGNNVSTTAPTSNQILKWNSGTSVWEPSTEISYSASGPGLSLSGTTFSAQNSSAVWNASQLQGNNISTTAPANKQVLRWNSTSSKWEPALDSNYWTRRNASTYTTDSVGIGGAPSGGKLHVNGSIRMTDGNQAAGKVMVSDANGKAAWGAPFTFYKLDGYVGSSIAASSTAWNMVGPSVTITVNAGQRITYVVEAPLGTTSGTASFEYDLVYQNTSSITNPIVNMVGGNYSIGQVSTIRTPFTATGSYTFTTAGTYKISFGVYNVSTTIINNNDYLNGWFMITDL
jgi:hypothetical protein